MANAKILSLEQTDTAGLFTIIFEGEDDSEFIKFVEKFKNDAKKQNELNFILNQIDHMLRESGFLERNFRPEGKYKDNVVALPVYKSSLRLYCLRLSDSILIVGNGGIKTTSSYEKDEELNGYVISLQKLDELIRNDIKKGIVRIEKTEIVGDEEKVYDI